MPPSHTALVRRARRIDRELALLYPDVHTELNFSSPLELLVATILSAQTTDKRVNMVTPTLFARYPTAADYAAARSLHQECQSILGRVGDRAGMAWSINHQGDVAREQGDRAAADSS